MTESSRELAGRLGISSGGCRHAAAGSRIHVQGTWWTCRALRRPTPHNANGSCYLQHQHANPQAWSHTNTPACRSLHPAKPRHRGHSFALPHYTGSLRSTLLRSVVFIRSARVVFCGVAHCSGVSVCFPACERVRAVGNILRYAVCIVRCWSPQCPAIQPGGYRANRRTSQWWSPQCPAIQPGGYRANR